MKIYFAGSIRGGREYAETYSEIIEYLRNFGEVVTKHVGDQRITANGESAPDNNIFERDMRWLEGSDVVVAEVSSPSLGVGYELAVAEKEGKRILCLCRSGVCLSAMIAGNPNVSVRTYRTMAEIQQHVSAFLSGAFL